jgi:predicted metal-dependent enzyme (double-stranded beta helix superfamily)
MQMNMRQQELFDRLENALNYISDNPKTAAEVNLMFEDLVISFEEIASDLRATSDEQEAKILKGLIHSVKYPQEPLRRLEKI